MGVPHGLGMVSTGVQEVLHGTRTVHRRDDQIRVNEYRYTRSVTYVRGSMRGISRIRFVKIKLFL